MLKILYAGSPAVSATVLENLIASGKTDIVGVLTNAPAPAGRSGTCKPTPVAQAAQKANIRVLDPEKLDAALREKVAAFRADILVCFAYGKIFGPKFLSLFAHGGINLHPSLLPKYRGCAPIPAAILAGETKTGVSVQRIAEKMDTGDILAQTELLIRDNSTAQTLLNEAAETGSHLLLDVLNGIENGTVHAVAQTEKDASYCSMIQKEDGLLNWTNSACSLCRQVRALQPWPGTYTYAQNSLLYIKKACVYKTDMPLRQNNVQSSAKTQNGAKEKKLEPGTVVGIDKNIGILVQTGDGILAVQELQRQSKKSLMWKDFLNGCRTFIGCRCTEA